MNKTISKYAAIVALGAGLSGLAVNANAGVMTLETKSITSIIDDTDFLASWNNESSSATTSYLNVFDAYKSGRDTISHLSIDFLAQESSVWGIQAGLDAGYGAALYFDGTMIASRTDDLWWRHDWKNSDVMTALDIDIASGAHTIDLYWAEACCEGGSSGRFTTDGGVSWQALSVNNVDAAAAVSEPASFALFGLGLAGLGFARKRMS